MPGKARCLALAAALLGGAGAAGAQDGVVFLNEEPDPVWNVSGQVVAGVMVPSARSAAPQLSLWAAAPSFCADLVSRERSYRATVALGEPATAGVPGGIRIDQASEHAELLTSIGGDQMAVRAVLARCDAVTEDTPLAIAAWGSAPIVARPDEIEVLVNARTSEAAVMLTAVDWAGARAACAKVEDPQRSGYDFKCRLSLAGLPDGPAEIAGTVVRRDLGQRPPPAHFKIDVAD